MLAGCWVGGGGGLWAGGRWAASSRCCQGAKVPRFVRVRSCSLECRSAFEIGQGGGARSRSSKAGRMSHLIVGRHLNIRSKRSAGVGRSRSSVRQRCTCQKRPPEWTCILSRAFGQNNAVGASECACPKRPPEWTCMLGRAFGRSSSVWPANVHV